MFHRDTCHREIYQRNSRGKRFPREACLHLGDVKVEMKRRMKSLSWRKDLKLNDVEVKTFSWERIQIERGTVFLRDTCYREI